MSPCLRRAQREADPTAEVWDTALSIGAIVKGEVHARKDYGVMCDLAAHPDVVGLVTPEQVIFLLYSVHMQLFLRTRAATCLGILETPQHWRV